jgi:hypothetical protein
MKEFELTRVLLLAFIVPLTLVSCATVTRGSTDILVVESDPPGAAVTVSTGEVGVTPTSFTLRRRGNYLVNIDKPGYEALQVDVRHRVSGAGSAGMAGNILLGGIIGAAVDSSSGAMYDLVPNPIKVKLVALSDGARVSPQLRFESDSVIGLTAAELVGIAGRRPDHDNAGEKPNEMLWTYQYGPKSFIFRLVDGRVAQVTRMKQGG